MKTETIEEFNEYLAGLIASAIDRMTDDGDPQNASEQDDNETNTTRETA